MGNISKPLKGVGRNIAMITLLTFFLVPQGCNVITGRVPTQSYLKQHPNIIRHYTEEEADEINKNSQKTPEIYKEELLHLYLSLIANKNITLAQQIAKLPFMNSTITSKGVQTLKQFYEIIKELNFPEDFGKGELRVFGSRELFVYTSDKKGPKILKALDDAVKAGMGEYRYSSMLEAFMWMIEDGQIDQLTKMLNNYEGMMPFVIEAWGKMEGIRWKEYEKVAKRLNHPNLNTYYVKNNFTYQNDKLKASQDSKETFEKRGGVCRHYAAFVTEALFRAGYDVKNLTVTWGSGWENGHTVSVLIDKNGKYWVVMDSRRPGSIMGPNDNYDEIAKKIAKGQSITSIYIENNFQLIERNAKAR
jgi:hypothetical protein